MYDVQRTTIGGTCKGREMFRPQQRSGLTPVPCQGLPIRFVTVVVETVFVQPGRSMTGCQLAKRRLAIGRSSIIIDA